MCLPLPVECYKGLHGTAHLAVPRMAYILADGYHIVKQIVAQ